VIIEYSGGVRGVVDVRWNSHVARDQFRVIGTDGEIDLDPLNGPLLRSPQGDQTLPPHANLHYPIVENFVNALLDGKELACPGDEAVWTDWVTETVK